VRWIDTSILKTGDLARYRRSLLVDSARAPPRRRLSRSDLVQWHVWDPLWWGAEVGSGGNPDIEPTSLNDRVYSRRASLRSAGADGTRKTAVGL